MAAAPAIPQETLSDLQTLAMLGRPKKLERVNLAARIEEIGLHQFLGVESWPEAAPCRLAVQVRRLAQTLKLAIARELASKIRSLTGEDCTNPFVLADFHKYAYCSLH